MIDPQERLKEDVAEIKFLIHDLRVGNFINEVIHFHVTVNTDLEIYNIDQARVFHAEDLQELKVRAVDQRKAFQDYCNAVRSFSPEKSILEAGRKYVKTIYDVCELILNPRWGRSNQVLSFLPRDSRAVRSHPHYMNCIRWISGVHSRIRHFLDEVDKKDLHEEFDIAEELQYFVRNVVYGYVTEKISARVEIQLDRMDPAVLKGNRYRFRRMFFNLVMNAVDAMSRRKVGALNISTVIQGDRVVLQVRDNGSGMPPEKIQQLMTDKKSLDGELHSLGFVFVRRTVADFQGEISIDSEVGKGTTVSISLPYLEGRVGASPPPSAYDGPDPRRETDGVRQRGKAAYAKKLVSSDEKHTSCGELIYADYMISDAQFPGSIFAMGVAEDDKIDFFTHKRYERYWNITHEDLSPMFFEATVRGRLEEEEDKTPVLILKAPQNIREYFEFRSVPDEDRQPDRYIEMVHNEYIRIARKLIDTGMSPHTMVRLTDLQKFFADQTELTDQEPFPLERLAKQRLTTEQSA